MAGLHAVQKPQFPVSQVAPRRPGPGGVEEPSAGQLRELLARAKKTLGSIVTLCISTSLGDTAARMANIALLASNLLRELEAV